MARLKITNPLFADRASGNLSRLGCYESTGIGRARLTATKTGNPTPVSMSPEEKAGFAEAVAFYKTLPRSWQKVGGEWRYLAAITWPAFASNWYSSNGNSWIPIVYEGNLDVILGDTILTAGAS